jgi:hypothetical protein
MSWCCNRYPLFNADRIEYWGRIYWLQPAAHFRISDWVMSLFWPASRDFVFAAILRHCRFDRHVALVLNFWGCRLPRGRSAARTELIGKQQKTCKTYYKQSKDQMRCGDRRR